VIARRDDSMRLEIVKRVHELGLVTSEGDVKVTPPCEGSIAGPKCSSSPIQRRS